MTQHSVNAPGGPDPDDETPGDLGGGQTFASTSDAEDVLDDIDAVLGANAETFVRSFVQKGGQ